MRNLMKQVGAVIWSGFLAFVIVLVGQGVWGTLAFTNLRTTPAIPCPVMALLLWLLWRHLGGQGWPRRTAATRQRLLRAKRVRAPVFAWALVAGVLIVALAGYWVVMFNLVKMPGNLVPDVSKYPPLTGGAHAGHGHPGGTLLRGARLPRLLLGHPGEELQQLWSAYNVNLASQQASSQGLFQHTQAFTYFTAFAPFLGQAVEA